MISSANYIHLQQMIEAGASTGDGIHRGGLGSHGSLTHMFEFQHFDFLRADALEKQNNPSSR